MIVEGKDVFDQCTDTIIRQVDDIKRMVDEFSSFARMPKRAADARRSRRLRAPGRCSSCASAGPRSPSRTSCRTSRCIAEFDRRLISPGADQRPQERRPRGSTRSASTRRQGPHLGRAGRPTPTASRASASATTARAFPSEDRHKLIEPYVTTRAEGTGLGLPIVIKIFEDHRRRRRIARRPARAPTAGVARRSC